jgi:hypothetical protein
MGVPALVAKRWSRGEPSVRYRSSHRRTAALSYFGDPLGIQMDQLQKILERQVREFTGGILGHPECSTLDGAAEPNLRVGLGDHERMPMPEGKAAGAGPSLPPGQRSKESPPGGGLS